jgi:uncharacterized SAM-binding protein YcdF (DUF218 family)
VVWLKTPQCIRGGRLRLFLDWIATLLLVPPVNLTVLAFLCVLLGGRRGRGAAAVLLLLVLVLGMPAVAQRLLISLEPAHPVDINVTPQAIVILSAELAWDAGPPLRPEAGLLTLQRLAAGAELARRTHLPVLVTGGLVEGDDSVLARQVGPVSLGAVMATTLQQQFGVAARWTETQSRTTWENAAFSAQILRAAGVGVVYVVTDAWHERRAAVAFAAAGMPMVPAPVRWDVTTPLRPADLLPNVSAWQCSYWALHEWIGLAWYEAWRRLG